MSSSSGVKKFLYGLFAGLCYGFAYLCKPEGIGFLLVGLILMTGYLIYQRTKVKKTLWLIIPLCVAGFIAFASIYMIYLRFEAGYWTLSAKGVANQQFHKTFFTPEDDDIFRNLNPENTSLPMDEIFHAGTFLENPQDAPFKLPVSYLVRKYVTNLFRMFKYGLPSFLTLWGLLLLVLGFFNVYRRREVLWPGFYLLAFPAFYWFVLIPSFTVLERYMQSMLPAALVWMGIGIAGFQEWSTLLISETRLSKNKKLIGSLLTCLIALLLVVPEMGKIISHNEDSLNREDPPVESKEAGLWIRSNGGIKDPVIMSYNKGIDFYAGGHDVRKAVSFPQDSLDRILAYADNRGVDFFVVEERFLDVFPNLHDWVDGSVPEGLQLLCEKASPGGLRAWVFRKAVQEEISE